MKSYAPSRGLAETRDLASHHKIVTPIKGETPVEMQPTFTLTFTLGTPMREINDTVIRTVLQYTRSNRLRAAQLLQINPRTIRRRLGKKEGSSSASIAA